MPSKPMYFFGSIFVTLFAITLHAASPPPVITVEKSPQCGCCQAWVNYLQQQGWRVQSQDVSETTLAQHKHQLGIVPAQQSCHTAKVNGYVLEGHVPSAAIHKLLQQRPAISGLSVPGMPAHAPGMGVHTAGSLPVEMLRSDGKRMVFSVE